MDAALPRSPHHVAHPAHVRLRRWLDAELLSGAGFAAASFFLPYGLVMLVAVGAALVFAPILAYDLGRLGRRGWLTAYGLCGGGPLVGAMLTSYAAGRFALMALALVLFYALCMVLRYTVRDWMETDRWQAVLAEDTHA